LLTNAATSDLEEISRPKARWCFLLGGDAAG
jgi:hypothetical protein